MYRSKLVEQFKDRCSALHHGVVVTVNGAFGSFLITVGQLVANEGDTKNTIETILEIIGLNNTSQLIESGRYDHPSSLVSTKVEYCKLLGHFRLLSHQDSVFKQGKSPPTVSRLPRCAVGVYVF